MKRSDIGYHPGIAVKIVRRMFRDFQDKDITLVINDVKHLL